VILEWIESLFQNSSPAARAMGYVKSSIALSARARRNKAAWQSHISACHDLWVEILTEHRPRSVTVLGSGPLLELPLQKLLILSQEWGTTFRLVDIVHPRAVRSRWGKAARVRFLETDLLARTEIWGTDLVVSANLISQLSLDPLNYRSRTTGLDPEGPEALAFSQKVATEHLESLRNEPGTVYVYTDIRRVYKDPAGQTLEIHPSRIPVEKDFGTEVKSWTWDICPLGEVAKDFSISMEVGAYRLIPRPSL
jgi:hypothetical protein